MLCAPACPPTSPAVMKCQEISRESWRFGGTAVFVYQIGTSFRDGRVDVMSNSSSTEWLIEKPKATKARAGRLAWHLIFVNSPSLWRSSLHERCKAPQLLSSAILCACHIGLRWSPCLHSTNCLDQARRPPRRRPPPRCLPRILWPSHAKPFCKVWRSQTRHQARG